MKEGDIVLILPSCTLNEMRMTQLAGAYATVTDVVMKNDVIAGCWVKLSFKFLHEDEWYIPYSSIG